MTAVSIRVATPRDLAELDALLARAYPRLLKADYPPSVLVTALPLISRARPELLRTGTYFVAIASSGDMVGAGGWTRDRNQSDKAHIRHVVTDDRQVRRGVGRSVLRHAMEAAQASGVDLLECWSTRPAEPFYRAMGFASDGPIEVPLAPGISFPAVRMRRKLPGGAPQ